MKNKYRLRFFLLTLLFFTGQIAGLRAISVNHVMIEPLKLKTKIKHEIKAIIRVPQDFVTIQEAVNAANENDIVILSRGTYILTESVVINKPITLASEFINSKNEEDINATIITSDLQLDPLVQYTITANNALCQGITFKDARKQLTLECEYIEVLNCRFLDNTSDALNIEAAGGYFAYNYFENNGDEAIDADDSLDWIAEYNTIINPGDDGFEIRLHNNDRSERLHIIRNNYISGADEDGIQLIDYDGDSGRKFRIHNNIIRNSAMVGLGCTRNGNTVEDFEGSYMEEETLVFNNVFDNNNYGITGANSMAVINNIIVNNETLGLKKLDNNSYADYNCLFNNGENFDNVTVDFNNIFVDPLLKTDYALQAASPCIDAGESYSNKNGLIIEIPEQYIFGDGVDIGAKEFNGEEEVENSAPMVFLGENQVLLSPSNTLLLSGEVSDDGLPQNMDLNLQWSVESAPEGGQIVFSEPNSSVTEITFSKQGEYELKLFADDGEYDSSDKIIVVYAKDFNDTTIELTGSDYIEAEDYRYLIGEAEVNTVSSASSEEIVRLPFGIEEYGYTEHRLVTFQEGTYYVWINATGIDQESNELLVAFNDLQSTQNVQTLATNTYGLKNWVKVVFENIPEGAYPLRISAAEAGVSWDRIFITTDENTLPYKRVKENQLYPVPNTGNFTVALSDNAETQIKVFDIKGRLIYKTSVNDILFVVLDIPSLEKGVYVVTIENDTKKTTKKIIVH